jgi:hypothetical protein
MNKLLWAISHKTTAELVYRRVDDSLVVSSVIIGKYQGNAAEISGSILGKIKSDKNNLLKI